MRTVIKRILGERLNIDWKIAVITIVSTLLITVDYYYSPTSGNHFDSILLFIVIPFGITVFIFKEKPSDYGFKIGDWKTGLLLVILGLLFMAPIIWVLGTRNSDMHGYSVTGFMITNRMALNSQVITDGRTGLVLAAVNGRSLFCDAPDFRHRQSLFLD